MKAYVVRFFKTTEEGSEETGTVRLEGEKFRCTGSVIERLGRWKKDGISFDGKGPLYPSDGKAFLELLPYVYSGSYTRATQPQEEQVLDA